MWIDGIVSKINLIIHSKYAVGKLAIHFKTVEDKIKYFSLRIGKNNFKTEKRLFQKTIVCSTHDYFPSPGTGVIVFIFRMDP